MARRGARARGRGRETRAMLEMFVSALTTSFAAWSLASTHAPESLALLTLGVASIVADLAGVARPLPDARQGIQGGAHLGALVLPWVFASRVSADLASFDAFALWACVAGGFAAVARQLGARGGPVACALAASVAGATRLASTPERVPPLAALLLAHALLADALARRLPRAFPRAVTRAEAILIAHALALLVGDAAASATASALTTLTPDRTPPVHVPPHLLLPRDDPARFIAACAMLSCALLVAVPAAAEKPENSTRRPTPTGLRTVAGPLAMLLSLAAWLTVEVNTRGAFEGGDPVTWVARRTAAHGDATTRLAAYWTATLVAGVAAANAAAGAFAGEETSEVAAARSKTRSRTRAGTRRSVSKTSGVTSSSGAPGRRAPVILLRKTYHALAAAMFAPATLPRAATAAAGFALPPPELLATAYGAALALFAALEVARAWRLEIRVGGARLALGEGLHAFAEKFMDERDGGGAGIVLSHFSLLVGSAAPLWLTPEAWSGAGGTSAGTSAGTAFRTVLAPFSGIVTLGLGDAAASAAGAAGLGRTPICRGWRKTVEGAVAGAVANALGSWAAWTAATGGAPTPWAPVAVAAAGAAALEATTEQMDNAFLPLHHLALTGLAARSLVGRGS